MIKKCCDIKSGDLKHKIVIQSKSNVRKSGGGQTTTWATYATIFASITPKAQSEYSRAMGLEARASHVIVIRHNASVTPTTEHRIKFGSRYFDIKSVINVEEANRWYEIGALETAEAAA